MIPQTIMCCGQSGAQAIAQALTCQFECIRRLLYLLPVQYDSRHPRWHNRPDWFLAVGVPPTFFPS
jgi:hypothetical protein